MSDDRNDKLIAFLAGQLALTEHRSCVKIELEYSPATGYRPDPVKTWTPESAPEIFGVFIADSANGETDADAAKLAERRMVFVQRLVGEIISLAEDFADGYGSGTHRFCVRCHEHLGGRATHRFKVLPGYHGEDQALEVAQADPTQSGVVKMLMGHIEAKERAQLAMMQQFMGAMKHGIDTLRDQMDSLRTQNENLITQRARDMEAIESAKSKEHDRELELARTMGENERKDYMMKKFGGLLPAAMSAVLRKVAPGKTAAVNGHTTKAPAPIAAVLQKLAVTLTDDQKQQIQAALDIEQLVVLEQIIEDAIDGGGIMLATMVADFRASLRSVQIQALFSVLSDVQKPLLMQAIQMAQAQTTEPAGASKTDGPAQLPEGAS